MRVLFFSNVFPSPFAPTKGVFNATMVRELARRNEVHVASPVSWLEARRGGATRALAPLAGIGVTYLRYFYVPRILLHTSGDFMWWSLRTRLRRLARAVRPDIVLGYWTHPDGEVALRLARELRVPMVLMVGGSDIHTIAGAPRRRGRIAAVLRGVDHVVTMSADLKRRVEALGVPGDRVSVVYRGVDNAVFSPGDRQSARKAAGLPLDRPLLLWVGRMVPVKGLDVLVDAMSRLVVSRPDALLCLVGDGTERADLESRVRAASLERQVRFVGSKPQEELALWYRAADLTVLPSRAEGTPNVLLESIACGTRFVASGVGGVPEIADPVLDALVPAGDPQALAVAIDRALGHSRPPAVAGKRDAGAMAAELTALLERATTARAAETVVCEAAS